MEQHHYLFKTQCYYDKIKSIYRKKSLNDIWHKHGSPKHKSGNCTQCFQDWENSTNTNKSSFVDFGSFYLQNCKSIDEVYALAEELKSHFQTVKDNFNQQELNEILNIENIVDLIILHSVVETYRGFAVENEVKKYLLSKNKNVFKDVTLDTEYSIDLLVETNTPNYFAGIQVKPISFFLGNENKDNTLRIDRNKFFENVKKVKEKYKTIENVYFAIYKIEKEQIFFYYTKNNDIFHCFSNHDDMLKNDWQSIFYDKTKWKTISNKFEFV